MKFLLGILILILAALGNLKAQDAQRSQYYANPLELNPAYTGTSEFFSSYLNYRSQYDAFDVPYQTIHFSGDYHFQNRSSGLGISFNNDKSGPGYLTNTKFHILYASGVKISPKYTLRLGLKAGMLFRKLNFSDLIYADQLDNNGNISGPSAEPTNATDQIALPSIGSGLLFFHEKYWFGIAGDHLNNPDQSIIIGGSKLPPKFVFHTGYKFAFLNARGRVKKNLNEFSLIPMAQFKLQGPLQQFDIGIHSIIEPVMFGFWYRGIPIPSFEKDGLINQDALIFLFGLKLDDLVFSYSYDLGIGELKNTNLGSHELTISLKFAFFKNGVVKTYPKMLPMPTFY